MHPFIDILLQSDGPAQQRMLSMWPATCSTLSTSDLLDLLKTANLPTVATEPVLQELDRRLKRLLAADEPDVDAIRVIVAELRRRESAPTPGQLRAMWPEYMRIFYPEPVLDPSTGIMLRPSCHGKDCPGNGENPGVECCCDECDYFLGCFPDWENN